jgi:hypothetical protein
VLRFVWIAEGNNRDHAVLVKSRSQVCVELGSGIGKKVGIYENANIIFMPLGFGILVYIKLSVGHIIQKWYEN